jgi:serine/threonine-protein kinase
MPDLTPGSIVAGYRIDGVAGRGGMGIVYRARQLALDRPVALKVIAPDLADDVMFRERFKRESLTAASIDHPNVIPVYEAGEAEGQLFIAMRWVEGTDLRLLIQDGGPMEPGQAIRVIEQVAAALDAAHRGGLVHRDVKPANVLITDDGERHVYLTDFGLTKQTGTEGMTKTGQFVGTPDYTAPEQIKGERADARTDVYALGCVLFQTVTGHVPFERDSEIAKMYAHLTDPPPSLAEAAPSAPPALDAVVRRALAKEADDRFQSAGDLGRAARAAVTGSAPAAVAGTVATGLAAPAPATEPSTPDGPPPSERAAQPTAPRAQPTAPQAQPTALHQASEAPTAATPETPATAAGPPSGGAVPARPPGTTGRRTAAVLWVLAGLVGLALVATALAVTGTFSGDDSADKASSDDSTPPPPSPPKVVASIPVGAGPDGITVADGTVWVSLAQDAAVASIDPKTNKVAETVPIGKNPDGAVGEKGALWVALTDENAVRRIDNADEAPVAGAKVPVGEGPEGISLGKQLVWVANQFSDSVTLIDRAEANTVGSPVGVGARPIGIFVGENTVWVANRDDGTVTRIDPSTREIIGNPIPVGSKPRGIVEGGGSAWVANSGDGTVSRLDAKTGKPVGNPIQVGKNCRDISFGEGFVWVTSRNQNTVTRIDPKTGRIAGSPIPVGTGPLGVAVGAGAVWVANFEDNTVTRIRP